MFTSGFFVDQIKELSVYNLIDKALKKTKLLKNSDLFDWLKSLILFFDQFLMFKCCEHWTADGTQIYETKLLWENK